MRDKGYQENFYLLYPDLHTHKNSRLKGQKIADALLNFDGIQLKELNCLDLGCSSGIITAMVAQYFNQTIGLDYDPIGLGAVTAENKILASFVRGDAMCLPFPSHSFDVVICAQVYEHVPDDLRLFAEIERILRPQGLVFFSGPNKMFPIEPHYNLLFLHWLPDELSSRYLKILKKGDHFYEKSRTIWDLQRIFYRFEIYDVTLRVMRLYGDQTQAFSRNLYRFLAKMPKFLWKILLPFIPNFNWILRIKHSSDRVKTYEILD